MYTDFLLLTLILLFAIYGAVQGFVKQVVSLLAFVTILFFSHPIASWLKYSSGWKWFQESPMVAAWGFTCIFILLLFLAAQGIIFLIRKNPILKPTDRWLGAGLGTLKGVMASVILLLGFQIIPENSRARFHELDDDARDSLFMKASASIFSWQSLGLIKDLHTIQDNLDMPRAVREGFTIKENPWTISNHSDADTE